jgi:alkylation response protein AidB-like acyl-CoA dehydrogenase
MMSAHRLTINERTHRVMLIHNIFEGALEIQQLVIAGAISDLRIE